MKILAVGKLMSFDSVSNNNNKREESSKDHHGDDDPNDAMRRLMSVSLSVCLFEVFG